MIDHGLASSVIGYLSILCWLIVFTPQLYENYKRKSGDGLSMSFLIIWLAGDVFNLLGVIMQDLLVTMFILALYYTIADMGLIWQVMYYQQKKKDELVVIEEEPLLQAPYPTYHTILNDGKEKRADKKIWLYNVMSGFLILFVLALSCYTYYCTHWCNDNSGDNHKLLLLPQLMGWTSALLYVGSRIPQIYKNYKNRSTDGLSFGMFICAVMGNVLFTCSIFLKSTDTSFLLMNLSWIVGSCGTLIFDFIVSRS
ncbi:PQ loop repeat-domain-containing protein [Pilobolus umbonatus]|nr:PQ loop repeat-domain-containing protein [Pilobolus umbonatus]